MPKLERWLVVTKEVHVVDPETSARIRALGGRLGGGWYKVHQHICVNADNKEAIEALLRKQGYTVIASSDRSYFHPEPYAADFGAQ